VDGVEGRLKVWIRRVWTLEMVSRPSSKIDIFAFKCNLADVCCRALLGCVDMHILLFLGAC